MGRPLRRLRLVRRLHATDRQRVSASSRSPLAKRTSSSGAGSGALERLSVGLGAGLASGRRSLPTVLERRLGGRLVSRTCPRTSSVGIPEYAPRCVGPNEPVTSIRGARYPADHARRGNQHQYRSSTSESRSTMVWSSSWENVMSAGEKNDIVDTCAVARPT